MLNKKIPARGGKKQNEKLWYYITVASIAFIVIGLTISFFGEKEITEKSYDNAALENIITEQLKIEKLTAPESKPEGKIIPPVSQYEVDQLRQNLNLQETEKEKDEIKLQHEEILKNNPQVQYVF
jgi:hypothetical protein